MATGFGSRSDMRKLREAINWSRERLQPFREHRLEALRQYVGANYSEGGASNLVPVNMIEFGINTLVRHLVASNPRVLVTTPYRKLKPTALDLELALNYLLEQIDFQRTMRQQVYEALFSIGIVKVGLEPFSTVEIDGFRHDVGQPYVDVVPLDDWVHDMTARRYEAVQFAGHKYRVPLEWAQANHRWDRVARRNLKAVAIRTFNEEGDEGDDALIAEDTSYDDQLYEETEIWFIWLPQPNLIVEFASEEARGGDGKTGWRPLSIRPWDGPENGPFHLLNFFDVPSQSIGLSYTQIMLDLHMLINNLFRKAGRQAERQKTVTGVRGTATDDGERILEANDGDMIRLDDPNAVREFRFGGADQGTLGMVVMARDWFNRMSGNLDLLSGISAMSDTATQDTMLNQNASKRVADMSDRFVKNVSRIVRDLAWYLFTDPLIEIPIVKRIPGLEDIEIPSSFGPKEREGEFLDYNIRIEPYSMQYRPPSARLRTMMEVFQNFVMPYLQLMQQQGIAIDFPRLLKTIARYADLPEIDDILIFTGANPYAREPIGDMPAKVAQTVRRYERVNRPAASPQGFDQQLMAKMFSMGQQPAQQAVLGRSSGS